MNPLDELETALKAVFDGTDVKVFAEDDDGQLREITAPREQPLFADTDTYPPKPKGWELYDVNSGDPMPYGEVLRRIDGSEHRLVGGAPPYHPASTGRVWILLNGEGDRHFAPEYFPSVFDLEWREVRS